MARLTIFAKGNGDLRDSLIARREGDAVAWNGINVTIGQAHPGWRAHVRHETLGRSDALLAAGDAVPDGLRDRPLPLGAYPAQSQFSTRLFADSADVVILSLQPEVTNALACHRGDGHLLCPHGIDGWEDAVRHRFAADYRPVPLLEPEQSMANLGRIIARLRAAGSPQILIYNLSPIVPWERVHNHAGLGESLSTRIRRFNLALVELSRETGVSIVDVDAVLAREGAAWLKVNVVQLNAAGCRIVAREVVRILADLGCFA